MEDLVKEADEIVAAEVEERRKQREADASLGTIEEDKTDEIKEDKTDEIKEDKTDEIKEEEA
jgi:hypothetical protein